MRSSSLTPRVVVFGALPWPVLLRAQQLTGAVEGTVKDGSGGVVVDTSVELVSPTNGIRQFVTSLAGAVIGVITPVASSIMKS